MQAAFSFFSIAALSELLVNALKYEYLTYFSHQDELVLNRHYDQFSRTRNQL
jgi:hypothetical protein